MKKEFSVLAACTVEEVDNDYMIVSFDDGNAEWNILIAAYVIQLRSEIERYQIAKESLETFPQQCLRFKKTNIAKSYVNRKLKITVRFICQECVNSHSLS